MSSAIIYSPSQNKPWSRNQSSCTSNPTTTSNNVYNPLTNNILSLSDANNQTQMFNKANILQYKTNSFSKTKNQKYAEICKGFGPNRTKALKSCNNITTPSAQICYSTSCSDVPGKEMLLCCNKILILKPWIPQKRYKMTNSGNDFPLNYKGFTSAVKPTPPTLLLINNINNIVSLEWKTIVSNCLPITNFNIYQNNILIQSVSSKINTISINISSKKLYIFYVTSISDNISSDPSNIIEILLP
jgi:hypothetical protein